MQTVVTAAQKRSVATTTFVYTDTAWYLSHHLLAGTAAGSILKKCLPPIWKMSNIAKPCHLYFWLRYSTDVYSSYKVQTMFWTSSFCFPFCYLFGGNSSNVRIYCVPAVTNKDDIPKHPYSLSLKVVYLYGIYVCCVGVHILTWNINPPVNTKSTHYPISILSIGLTQQPRY